MQFFHELKLENIALPFFIFDLKDDKNQCLKGFFREISHSFFVGFVYGLADKS